MSSTPPEVPTLASRIRASFTSLTVVDALGAPLEFQKRREQHFYLREMVPNDNFGLPAGHFTDDTSMALCLAHSLIANEGQHNAIDQASRYVRWLDQGYMSSVPGRAFDVGNQTRQTLQYWRKKPDSNTAAFIEQKFNEDWRCGNGSLMRVLPCALLARSEAEAVELARNSSRVTHPHPRCVDSCGLYSALVFCALEAASKEDLILNLQKQNANLEPDLRSRLAPYDSVATFRSQARQKISSSGYVLDSLEAALWAFFSTDTFEAGAIEVVNLGDDADTVGAIYGGLAGAFYGTDECIPKRWIGAMKMLELVRDVVDRISMMRDQK